MGGEGRTKGRVEGKERGRKIWGVSCGVDPSCWGSQRVKWLSYSAVKLFWQNSNLCDHDTSTSQTDRRTDNLPWQYCARLGFAR